MSEAAPPEPPAPPAPGATPGTDLRPPRKRFILIGFAIGLLIVVLIGLFTSIGSSGPGSGGGSGGGQPQAGDAVPAFSARNIGPVGPSQVSVPADGGGHGTPAVLLFFGAWCASCRQELPPLAAAVRQQEQAHGGLSAIRVIGVDSFYSDATAKSFLEQVGLRIPVASDSGAQITSGQFWFKGDPYTVFVKADGTIDKVVAGAQLTAASFTADERALIPSGT